MTGSLRRLLERAAERTLVAAGAPGVVRALRSGDDVVLAYHNVVPRGEPPGGDRSLHLPRGVFARQLDLLRESHRVVPLGDLLTEPDPRGPPRAAITFDDGYRGALTVGLRELRERSLPCSLFVSPGLLGNRSTWWDALADPEEGAVPTSVREQALVGTRGRDGEVRRWAEERGLPLAAQPGHASLVDEAALEEAVAEDGVTVGSHGWLHANMVELEGEELLEEVRRPLVWLRERFGDAVLPWLSLPYGHSAPHVVRSAQEAGYDGVLTLTGERVDADRKRVEVPRVNVPAGMSSDRFLLKISGL